MEGCKRRGYGFQDKRNFWSLKKKITGFISEIKRDIERDAGERLAVSHSYSANDIRGRNFSFRYSTT